MLAAEWFANLLLAYCATGIFFGVLFITYGISRVDPVARGARLGFRVIVLPGVVALWPFLLIRWARRGGKQ
jgi:hypothetical protein